MKMTIKASLRMRHETYMRIYAVDTSLAEIYYKIGTIVPVPIFIVTALSFFCLTLGSG